MTLARLVFETLTDTNAEKCRDHAHELFRALIQVTPGTDPRVAALNDLLTEGAREFAAERVVLAKAAA